MNFNPLVFNSIYSLIFFTEPEAHSQTDIKISRTRMIAIIVSVTGVVIALVLVLGFFIIRHRRLQRSFLAFANSHYDTRSGTTTFESNELGLYSKFGRNAFYIVPFEMIRYSFT